MLHLPFDVPASAGVGMLIMGGVGAVTIKKDITSIKTLHLTLAVVVGLLGSSYTSQVGCIPLSMLELLHAAELQRIHVARSFNWSFFVGCTAVVGSCAWHLVTCWATPRAVQVLITRQNDCILAETYMRLDHLESAMHNVRHEELINGIMMRLDHLSTDINHIKDHAEDKVEETKKQAEFKQLVRCFVTVLNQGLPAGTQLCTTRHDCAQRSNIHNHQLSPARET